MRLCAVAGSQRRMATALKSFSPLLTTSLPLSRYGLRVSIAPRQKYGEWLSSEDATPTSEPAVEPPPAAVLSAVLVEDPQAARVAASVTPVTAAAILLSFTSLPGLGGGAIGDEDGECGAVGWCGLVQGGAGWCW